MPTTPEGIEHLLAAGIRYGPAKAADAGGVAVSGLEMSQDSQRLQWTRQQVSDWLRSIMRAIHQQVSSAAEEYGHPGNYVVGADIAGFRKAADAMLDEAVDLGGLGCTAARTIGMRPHLRHPARAAAG